MNTFKKFAIASLATATIALGATAPANASHALGHAFANGLGMGVGAGIGLGITNAILNPRPQTVVVQQPQPVVQCRAVYQRDVYGNLVYAGQTC